MLTKFEAERPSASASFFMRALRPLGIRMLIVADDPDSGILFFGGIFPILPVLFYKLFSSYDQCVSI